MDWACREGRVDVFWWMVECSWWVRVVERAVRRASFSGFGGIGGAMPGVVGAGGRALSSEEVRRSGTS